MRCVQFHRILKASDWVRYDLHAFSGLRATLFLSPLTVDCGGRSESEQTANRIRGFRSARSHIMS